MTFKKSLAAASILLFALAGLQQAWAAAGTLVLATGQVFVVDAKGVQRAAAPGMSVDAGETLLTRDGRAQIKLTDGGLVSLQPASELKITDYSFKDAGKAKDSAIFNFVKGGLRAISGAIGSVDRQAYRMDSVVATIGIRGTEFKAILCDKNCKEPDGLYVQTGEGIVSVKNAFGEVEIGRGQTAYVPSPNDPPRKTGAAPTITAQPSVAPPPVVGVGTDSGFRPGDIISSNNLGEVLPMTSGGMGLAASGTATITSLFNGSWSGSGAGAGAGAGIVSAADAALGVGGVYLVNNELRGTAVKLNDGQYASVVLDRPVTAAADGNLYWGRWSNPKISLFASLSGYVKSEELTTSGLSLHYILGTTVPTIPTTGSASYSFIGGTASTDAAGSVGLGMTAGTLSANFFANTASANFAVNHNGSYSVSTGAMPFSGNRTSFETTTASVSGPGASTGTVSGFFAGTSAPTAPSHAGLTYKIDAASPIVGVGAFRCSSGC